MPRLSVCLVLVIFGSAAVAGQAEAQARFGRQQPAPVAPVLSDRVKPLVATPPAQVPAATKPSINADAVLSIDGLRGAIRGEQEQILAQLIDNTPDSEVEEKSDYYFRLGELYAKQQRFWRDKAIEATTAGKQKDAAIAMDKAKTYLLKTVKTYKGLTDNEAFRNYPKMDMALFYYAYTLQSGKYMKEARAVYDKLLKNYPNSKYVPEAHLAFADYYFDMGQLADAEARYKAVLSFPKSGVYAYAIYRMGWIDYELQKPQDAVEELAKVVSLTRGHRAQEALYHAAKADFLRAYAVSGKHDQSFATFQKLEPGAGIELLDVFADAAWTEGVPERVVTAYRELVSRAPGDEHACSWQYRIARAAQSTSATTASKVKEIAALVRFVKPDADAECRVNASAMTGELAAAYFAEWSKTQSAETLDAADQLYSLHVAAFPDDADARAQYAEVLWARADREKNPRLRRQSWQHATEMFAGIATPEAARAAALAWMNAADIVMPTDAKIALAKSPGRAPRPVTVPAADAKLLAAIDAYIPQATADDDDLALMRLAAAITWRKYRHFDEAAAMLDGFLEHHQSNARAELVANLLIDTMVQRGKPDETLDVVMAIAADQAFVDGKPELVRNLQIVKARSLHAAR